jgi:hypothetical protein
VPAPDFQSGEKPWTSVQGQTRENALSSNYEGFIPGEKAPKLPNQLVRFQQGKAKMKIFVFNFLSLLNWSFFRTKAHLAAQLSSPRRVRMGVPASAGVGAADGDTSGIHEGRSDGLGRHLGGAGFS